MDTLSSIHEHIRKIKTDRALVTRSGHTYKLQSLSMHEIDGMIEVFTSHATTGPFLTTVNDIHAQVVVWFIENYPDESLIRMEGQSYVDRSDRHTFVVHLRWTTRSSAAATMMRMLWS